MRCLLLLVLSLVGCVAPKFRPENIIYVPLNLAFDQLDNYSDKGSFPRIDKPLLRWGPLRISTSFRTGYSNEADDELYIKESRVFYIKEEPRIYKMDERGFYQKDYLNDPTLSPPDLAMLNNPTRDDRRDQREQSQFRTRARIDWNIIYLEVRFKF